MTGPLRAVLLVAVGGALGSVLRHLAAAAWNAPGRLAVGTLAVNLAGSFAIGLVLATGVRDVPPARLFLVTGVLGGFTTYSAFNEDVLLLLRAGQHARAFAYLALTLVGGLVAGTLGYVVARRLGG